MCAVYPSFMSIQCINAINILPTHVLDMFTFICSIEEIGSYILDVHTGLQVAAVKVASLRDATQMEKHGSEL
jgi:hypothetical protein